MSKKPSLAETHPELAKQWHPTKNGDLSPEKVSKGSNKRVWWKCDKGDDHEWQAQISSRSKGRGCAICSGYKVVNSNCLMTLHPEIAMQWHPTKNGKTSPKDVTANSPRYFWWKCNKGDDHEWKARIADRVSKGMGCGVCRGLIVVNSNCLSTVNPKLAKEWHPIKNGSLTPKDVVPGSSKKVWWKCNKGDDHEWQAKISDRNHYGTTCPYCKNQRVSVTNSLMTIFPLIAKEWHPTKNGLKSPNDFTYGSHSKVWWKCNAEEDHEWEAVIKSRTKGEIGCPFCSGQKVALSNCLATTNPQIARQWHPTKNGRLTPFDITVGSSKKSVWWKCDKGDDHEWKAKPLGRSHGQGCPVCANRKIVTSNSLLTLEPEISKEWHSEKNARLTPHDVGPGSDKKIWWQCKVSKDHVWKARIVQRTRTRSGCPYCTLTPQSRQELIITFELLKLFKNINPKGYKTRLNGRLRAIDIFIPELNLAIEFDGSYWHKDKRVIDKIKSEMLIDEGHQVIRIREQPLKKIHDNDIISKLPYNGKEITNNILKRILELYPIRESMKRKVQNYISKDGFQNEKALDKYIDQILEEKAAKKK